MIFFKMTQNDKKIKEDYKDHSPTNNSSYASNNVVPPSSKSCFPEKYIVTPLWKNISGEVEEIFVHRLILRV